MFFQTPLSAERIDLNQLDLYFRSGFSNSWSLGPPAPYLWNRLTVAERRNRNLRFSSLEMPTLPVNKIFQLEKPTQVTISYLFQFQMSKEDLQSRRLRGIFLAEIGERWEIHLNGKFIYGHQNTMPRGVKTKNRVVKKLLAPIHPGAFRTGTNVLVLKLTGEPHYTHSGLPLKGMYVIDNFEKLKTQKSDIQHLALIFVYLFFGLYHLIQFLIRKIERFHLYFSLYTLNIFFYFFFISFYAYEYLNDSVLIRKAELSMVFILLLNAGVFIDSLLNRSVGKYWKYYGIFCSICVMLNIFIPSLTFGALVLIVWQLVAIPTLGYLVFLMFKPFLFEFSRNKQTIDEQRNLPVKFIKTLGKTLVYSVAGNILLGGLLCVAFAIFDLLDSFYFLTGWHLSTYSFLGLIIGISFILAHENMKVHNKVGALNQELNTRVADLNTAFQKISRSEKRYKLLAEGTSDLVFTLNENLELINYNHNLPDRLQYSELELNKLTFPDLLANHGTNETLEKQLILEKINSMFEEKLPISFLAVFKIGTRKETIEMDVTLEFIQVEGKTEIFGRASRVIEEIIHRYAAVEKGQYKLSNSLIFADEIIHKITANLKHYAPEGDVMHIKFGLREMLINSIEHGNLDISYDEKTEATLRDDYLDFVTNRMEDERYKHRQVQLDYFLSSRVIAFKLLDEGRGFDHAKIRKRSATDVNTELLAHGRGIFITENAFNVIRYSKIGNEVLLVKRLK